MKEHSPPLFQEIDDTREFVRELREHAHRANGLSPRLSGGDVDARWDQAEAAGEETAAGSAPTPDQSLVDEIGDAWGIVYQPGEALKIGSKEEDRDIHRWELDPASAEDYGARAREHGLSETFLHMTHSGHRPHR
jgi:Family of unknown function (DUF6335)